MSETPLTVGQTVAQARLAAGMTLAQVAERTRIRSSLIASIEADDFRPCGGDVYARGHLKSIATSVGIDPAQLVREFDAQQGHAAQLAAEPVEPIVQPTRVMDTGSGTGLGSLAGTLGASIGGRRGTNWSGVMALALVVILGVVVVSFLTNRGGSTPAASGPGSSPQPSASAPSSPAVTPSTPAPSTPAPSSSSPDLVASADGVTVKLAVTGRASWMRVTGGATGKKTIYEGTLTKGETKTFTDKVKVTLLIGNAGAVSLNVNTRDLGAPGGAGQVVKTSFGPGDPTTQTG